MALVLLQFPQTRQKLLGNAGWFHIAQFQSQQIDAFGRRNVLLHLVFGFGSALCAMFEMLSDLRTRLLIPKSLEGGSMERHHLTFLCPLFQMAFIELPLDMTLHVPEICKRQAASAFACSLCLQFAQQGLGDAGWKLRRRLAQIGHEVGDLKMFRFPLFARRCN